MGVCLKIHGILLRRDLEKREQSRKKMRKNFLKVEISEFVRKIVICGSSHILRIDLQSSNFDSFQKN
ncbi:hypothetical protein LEP1GSC051_2770, partial [Leptospira sp. P2653]